LFPIIFRKPADFIWHSWRRRSRRDAGRIWPAADWCEAQEDGPL